MPQNLRGGGGAPPPWIRQGGASAPFPLPLKPLLCEEIRSFLKIIKKTDWNRSWYARHKIYSCNLVRTGQEERAEHTIPEIWVSNPQILDVNLTHAYQEEILYTNDEFTSCPYVLQAVFFCFFTVWGYFAPCRQRQFQGGGKGALAPLPEILRQEMFSIW